MFTEDKITEIYCIADDFLKLFNNSPLLKLFVIRYSGRLVSSNINEFFDKFCILYRKKHKLTKI